MLGLFLITAFSQLVSANPVLGSEKAQALRDLSAQIPNSLIRLNGTGFEHYVMDYPRPYTLVVLLTADINKYKCKVCTDLLEALESVIYSYVHEGADYPLNSPTGASSRAVFFAVVEHGMETQDLFVRFGVKSVPVLLVTHPKSVAFDGNRYLIPREDVWEFHPGSDVYQHKLLEFINNRSQRNVEIQTPPIQAVLTLAYTFLIVGSVLFALFKLRDLMLSPYVWFIVTMLVYYFCISGVVYDIIHKTPMVGRTGKNNNQVEFIHSGRRTQYAGEGFLMGMCATVAALCMIGIRSLVKLDKPAHIRIAGAAALLAMVLCLYIPMKVFQIKSPSYGPSIVPPPYYTRGPLIKDQGSSF